MVTYLIMKKYRQIRKILSHEEANRIYQTCLQAISVSTDNINYWLSKKKSDGLFHIDRADIFILNVGMHNSPEDIIKQEKESINYFTEKINDIRRFFDENKEIRGIF